MTRRALTFLFTCSFASSQQRSPELAKQAVAACKYSPEGKRGVGPRLATLRWPAPGGYPQGANKNVMVLTIIERRIAVEQIEEIADSFRFIQGPSDLSLIKTATRDFFKGLKTAGVEKKEPIPLY